jgi:hypothetical protein
VFSRPVLECAQATRKVGANTCFALAKLETQLVLPWQNLKLNLFALANESTGKLVCCGKTFLAQAGAGLKLMLCNKLFCLGKT